MRVELTKECPMCGGLVEAGNRDDHCVLWDAVILRCCCCKAMSVVGGDAWVAKPYGDTLHTMAQRVHDEKKAAVDKVPLTEGLWHFTPITYAPEQIESFYARIYGRAAASANEFCGGAPIMYAPEAMRVAHIDEQLVIAQQATQQTAEAQEPKQETWRDRRPLL